MGHMSDISKELGKAGAKVNSVFSSYNKSVLPSIRRIEDITAQSDEIEELKVESSLEKNCEWGFKKFLFYISTFSNTVDNRIFSFHFAPSYTHCVFNKS